MRLLLLLLLLSSPLLAQADYRHSVEDWHRKRIASLTGPEGWLSLAGLFWLEPGENRFGSDPQANRLVFPKGPARIGSYFLDGTSVRVTLLPQAGVTTDGHPITEQVLDPQADEGSSVLQCGSLSWYPIEREGRWGIRLKDADNPARLHFRGIERYPVDERWRLEGRFEPHGPGVKITVPNVLGSATEEDSPGTLAFQVKGQTYRLESVREPGESRLFVIFGDATNGKGSYGGGRFVYVDPPDEQGRVVIDFNRSYNPPCCFTNFATCPRPPASNRLPIAVEAGEKVYEH